MESINSLNYLVLQFLYLNDIINGIMYMRFNRKTVVFKLSHTVHTYMYVLNKKLRNRTNSNTFEIEI